MAIAPKCIHEGTPEKKDLTINLRITTYASDPRVMIINDSFETTTLAEIDMGVIFRGLKESLSKKVDGDVAMYFNTKNNVLYFQKPKDAEVDEAAATYTW